MDNHVTVPSESQQYQQYYQHYQQQQEATNPSAYDPSTQSYNASYQPYNPTPHQPQEAQPDYSSYYYPDYSSSYQPHPQTDSSWIHPPGVTIPSEMPQTLVQNHPDVYYRHGFVNLQQQQPQNGYMAPGYTTFAARGGRGSNRNRVGRHGFSRGRGGTRGTASVNHIPLGIPRQVPQPSSSGPGQAALAPPRMAWCELCKVDCNTPEVLEQHKNGKKHMKNLKVYEERLTQRKVEVGLQNPNIQGLDSNLVAVQPEKKEGGPAEKQPMISDTVSGNNIGGVDTAKDSADKSKPFGAQTSEERVQIGGARGGCKRKMRGVYGGKLMRSSDGSRKPVAPAKPKKAVDMLCELCSVKCKSQVVFNSHMAGKKHLSNIKKLQGHQAVMGSGVPALHFPMPKVPSTLQALYPPTPNVPSTPFTQENQQGLTEASSLASTLVNQQGAVQDPQAALVQLLNQHGIQDTQSLLAQMIAVLLTQVLRNGATSVQLGEPASASLGNVTQDQQNPVVAHMSSGENESKSEMVGIADMASLDVGDPFIAGLYWRPVWKGEMEAGESVQPPTMSVNTSTQVLRNGATSVQLGEPASASLGNVTQDQQNPVVAHMSSGENERSEMVGIADMASLDVGEPFIAGLYWRPVWKGEMEAGESVQPPTDDEWGVWFKEMGG